MTTSPPTAPPSRFIQAFVFPLLVPVLVGIGSSAVTGAVLMTRLEERVSYLELQIQRHEQTLGRDMTRHESAFSTLTHRTDDQEQRLSKLEAMAEEARASLSEIRGDIKTLLRGKGQGQ